MKLNIVFKILFIVTLYLAISGLVLVGDPVPGIDVALEQVPGGIIKTIKTDKDGKFVFDKLKQGTYLLKLVPTKVENHNSSRSNKTYPRVPGGTTECVVAISLSKSGEKKPFQPIEVTIGSKGGKISGQIILEVAIKEEGVK